MKYFAKIESGNVVRVNVFRDDFTPESLEGVWVETAKTGLRKNFAGRGMIFDLDKDAFYHAAPFPSWVLDEETCRWSAPVPRPDNISLGQRIVWDEDNLEWAEVGGP